MIETPTDDAVNLGILIEPEIRSWLENRNYKELRESLQELDPFDIAQALLVLSPEERAIVFRILPRRIAAEVFAHLPLSEEEELLHSLGNAHVSGILNELAPDDRTALLEELPGQVTKRLIGSLSPQERQVANTLLGYPEYSVGRLMTPEYVAVPAEWSIKDTLNHIRLVGREKETINVIYVFDENDHLAAYLPLRRLLISDPDQYISEIMRTNVVALNAFDDQETAADVMARYDMSVLPVIDSEGTLVGIVTADDVLDVVVEESTEDIHLMGGLEALDEPYNDISFFSLFRKRAGALMLLFLGGTLTVTAMGVYASGLEKSLLIFIPLIISSGGNSGSQAATLVIRALSTQEIRLGDWFKVLGREFGMGIMLGILLGAIAFFLVPFWPGGEDVTAAKQSIIALTVGCAVITVVLYGTTMGAMLPFVLKRCGMDPAFSSTPLVATVVDATGIIIYCMVAALIFY